jgi:hypothetical protein
MGNLLDGEDLGLPFDPGTAGGGGDYDTLPTPPPPAPVLQLYQTTPPAPVVSATPNMPPNPTLTSDPASFIGGLLLGDGQSAFNSFVTGPQNAQNNAVGTLASGQSFALASAPWVTVALYALIAWVIISLFKK